MLNKIEAPQYTDESRHLGKIILFGIIACNLFIGSANAQSRTADSFNFDKITVGNESNWNFSSEDETVSIRDNLQNLREYDLSNIENFDLRLIRERRRRLGIKRWGNKGDRSYYSIEDGVYPYYFPATRTYNYY